MSLGECPRHIYGPGERGLGHWVGADLIGIRCAKFLSKIPLSVCTTTSCLWGLLCAHILTVSPAAYTFCQTGRYDISPLHFSVLHLPWHLSISLNTRLLFGFSCKLLVHILCPFAYWSWYHFFVVYQEFYEYFIHKSYIHFRHYKYILLFCMHSYAFIMCFVEDDS